MLQSTHSIGDTIFFFGLYSTIKNIHIFPIDRVFCAEPVFILHGEHITLFWTIFLPYFKVYLHSHTGYILKERKTFLYRFQKKLIICLMKKNMLEFSFQLIELHTDYTV